MDITEDFVIDKTRHVILAGESRCFLLLMLKRSMEDAVGYAGVESS